MTTLLDLRTRVLGYLNDPVVERYNVPSVNSAINDAMIHYQRILQSNYQGYLSTNYSLDVISGQKTYALSAAFRSPVYQVRRTIQLTDYFLDPFIPYNVLLDTNTVDNSSWLPFWYLEGNSITFSTAPASNETGAVIIKHQEKLTRLSIDASPLNDQMYDAEDCIVLKATIRLLKSKDVSGAFKDIGGFRDELKEAENSFWSQVGNRYVKPDRPLSEPGDNFGF